MTVTGMGQMPQQMGFVQQQPMMGYNPNLRNPKKTQTLSKEGFDLLRKNGDFKLGLTDYDIAQSICVHRDENGNNLLCYDPTDPTHNKVYCPLCHESFYDINATKEEIQAAIEPVIDILQCIKSYYWNMPDEAAKDFFTVIGLVKKLPGLWEQACANINQYDRMINNPVQGGSGQMDSFAMYNQIVNPMASMGMMPGYPQQMQQGMMQGYPVQPGMVQGLNAQMNMGYPPQVQQPGVVPGYPQQMGMGMYPQQQMQQGMMQGYPQQMQQQPMSGGNAFGGYPNQMQQAVQPTPNGPVAQPAQVNTENATSSNNNGNGQVVATKVFNT